MSKMHRPRTQLSCPGKINQGGTEMCVWAMNQRLKLRAKIPKATWQMLLGNGMRSSESRFTIYRVVCQPSLKLNRANHQLPSRGSKVKTIEIDCSVSLIYAMFIFSLIKAIWYRLHANSEFQMLAAVRSEFGAAYPPLCWAFSTNLPSCHPTWVALCFALPSLPAQF